MDQLSALTLTEPWSTLCLAPLKFNHPAQSPEEYDLFVGINPGQPLKLHETRGYRLSGTPRRIVIHAGQGAGGMRDATCDHFGRFTAPYARALEVTGYSSYDPWQLKYEELRRKNQPTLKSLALGCIIGLVTVTRMVSTGVGSPAHAIDRALGNWAPGRWAWQLTEPWMLEKPFHARGYQSVWKVMDHQAALIREQGGTW